MSHKTFQSLVAESLPHIQEVMPWDLEEMLQSTPQTLVVDIREADEFDAAHIQNSLHVPRGILESACDWGYAETIPTLAQARDRPLVLACRSGNRTALAALTLQWMGYQQVYSLKTGVRGWNDYELPLYNNNGELVDGDEADIDLNPPVQPEQMEPRNG